jgi:NAD(P)-dependent dehydrogenase (short-subunit alcohol dehydrogenase family)
MEIGMSAFPRFDLDGQVALVTGAARGLGREIALAVAHAGADVVLGLRVPGTADDLVDEIAAMGHKAIAVPMDVRDPGQINEAVSAAVSAFGRLDILVNNAGLGPANPAELVTEADFDLTFDVNVKGLFFASQAAARVMMAQRHGRIVNLSSQAGFVALPTEAIYCASKAAVSHLTKCLAVEWGALGITVNAVAPTFIRTPGTEADLADPEFRADVVERIAGLHRIGEPVDVTGAVIFLASPAASLITGTTLLVDGGWTAR